MVELLRTERDEVKARLDALVKEGTTGLSSEAQKLIGKQKNAMAEYLGILNHRLMSVR